MSTFISNNMIIGASSFAGTFQQLKDEVNSVELYVPKLGVYDGRKLNKQKLGSILDELSVFDLATSIHAPYFADVPTYPCELIVDTANMADKDFNLMKESIELASRLGSRAVVMHPGRIGHDRESSFLSMVENLRSLAHIAEDCGVVLGLENKEGTDSGNLCCKADELIRAVQQVDSNNLGITFDLGHANLTCGGNPEKMKEFASSISKDIVHMHLHDNNGQWTDQYAGDAHMAPGSGTVDFSVLEEISGYQGIYNLEVFSIDDVLAGKDIIHRFCTQ